MKDELLTISYKSLQNIIDELQGLKKLLLEERDIDEKDAILEEGTDEISYNIELLMEGIEYCSDEYSYLAKRIKECE